MRGFKLRSACAYLLVLVGLIAALAACFRIPSPTLSDTLSAAHTLTPLSDGWYRLENGQRVEVTLPCTITVDGAQDLVLYNDTLFPERSEQTLTTRAALYRVEIRLGKRVLYRYDDTGFPRDAAMRSKLDCDAFLPESDGTMPLQVRYENPGDGVFYLPLLYVGSSQAVFLSHLAGGALTLVLVFTMALFSLVSLIVFFCLFRIRMRDWRFVNISLFLLLCGLWCLLSSSLVQDISHMSPSVCILASFFFTLIPIPMGAFVLHTESMRRFRILQGLMLIFCLNAAVQALLQCLGICSYMQMLLVTHLLMAGGAGLCGVLMWAEYRRTRSGDLRAVLRSFCALMAGGLPAMVLYWIPWPAYDDVIFEAGLMVFILCLFFSLINTAIRSLHLRTEIQIYKRLSREDRLTGLMNRRAFEDFSERLESGALECRDAALLFMDLDHLKYTNDHFGHGAGDELIIGAARCIREAYADAGSCYRIGGDEFAAVLLDPTQSAEDLNTRLDEAIGRYNQTARYRLSISRGCSFLLDADGSRKRIGEWKYEADQAMYRYKLRTRGAREMTPEEAAGAAPEESAP